MLRPLLRRSKQRVVEESSLSLLLSIGAELLQVGPQVAEFLVVFNPREKHGRAGDLAAWVLDELLECLLGPRDAGAFETLAVIEVLDTAGLPAVETVKHGSELVLGAFADVMAELAFPE